MSHREPKETFIMDKLLSILQISLYTTCMMLVAYLLIKYNNIYKSSYRRIYFNYRLIRIIGSGIDSIVHKALFVEMLDRGPNNIMTPKEEQDFFKKFFYEANEKNKEELLEEKKRTNDPINKEIIEKRLTELDNITNLLNAVDVNDSPEQAQVFINSIADSIEKYNRLNRDYL